MSTHAFASFLPRTRATGVQPWSNSEIRRLRELAQQGLVVSVIAEQLRRSPSAVRNKAGLHGIAIRSAPHSVPRRE